MTAKEAMQALEKAGTPQNRKVYARHGVGEKMYGVSFADLRALAKEARTDHGLASDLWATGNHDARMLAALVADPASTTAAHLDQWVKGLDNYLVADAFADFVARTPFARAKADKWCGARGEWMGRAGWRLVAHLAMKDAELPDSWFEERLGTIASEIHGRRNLVRDAMNNALIAIGVRSPVLTKKALAVAKRIGTVEVDHGETGCKTPDAAAYIQKTLAWRTRKKKK